MSAKRRSVFTILLLRILVVVILFDVISASMQIYKWHVLQKRDLEKIHTKSQAELAGLMNSWTTVQRSINEIFHITLENALQKLSDLSDEQDLETVDLKEQMKTINIDTLYFKVRIIRDSMVVNTTSSSDLGINLYPEGINHEDLISEIKDENSYVLGPCSINYASKRFQSYGYIASKNKKYIIKVDCYSSTADELLNLFANQLRGIVEEGDHLLSANQYIGTGQYHFGLINESVPDSIQNHLVSVAFSNKTNFSRQFSKGNMTIIADYGFLPTAHQLWQNDNSIFSVITGIPNAKTDLMNIIKLHASIFLYFLVLLTVIFVITTWKLRKTLKDLHVKTKLIADGNLKERIIIRGKNEFTTLAEQFNIMIEKLEFSKNELKQKNDVIGENLRELNEKNEEITAQIDKMEMQNEEIVAQRDEIEAQRDMVSKQKEIILEQMQSITDSILYANKIQTAILPPDDVMKYLLPKHFVLYKPRDVVSGDFYWLTHKNGEIVVVVADCTGHGVPGAFMMALGSALLKSIVDKSDVLCANLILNDLRDQIILSLRQSGQMNETQDGMDISLGIIDLEKMKLQFAGAYHSMYLVREGWLKEIDGDKMPLGISSKAGKSFTNHEIQLLKNDVLYFFTDGYADQFGGEYGKKFLPVRFRKLLLEIQDNIMIDQKEVLDQKIKEWMGATGLYQRHKQIDDITVMGIKI